MKLIPANRKKEGMAIILVLAILVLLSALVVGFLLMVTDEFKSSSAYVAGTQSRQLADSATQLVIAQIVAGTKGTNSSGNKLSWASQPGMIRTYDDQGAVGALYKLYSSSQLIVPAGTTYDPTADAPAYTVWSSQPGLYSDLNQPVLVRDDTNGTIVPDQASPGNKYIANYPVLDPAAVGNVEGFSISGSASGYTGSYPTSGTYNPVTNPNPAPLPVKWMYILRSGSLAVTTNVDANGIVRFDTASAMPSAADPIVGRIAFWTDDETCKLNINTAAEGTCYDVPRGSIQGEVTLARSMPIKDEFQRTPGHPAMTSLSPALGWVLPRPDPIAAADYPKLTTYYDIAPRINYTDSSGNDFTSQGGTRSTMTASNTISLTLDADRLYTSLDELIFKPGRTVNKAALTKQVVEQSKFFLTASSRAPETNLFNQPRIGLWPLQSGTDVNSSRTPPRDPKDKLLEFCTKIGGNPYYFQRYSEGPGNWNFLDTWDGVDLTKIPSCMSNTVDYNLIPRNRQIYQYLQNCTATNIPGFGDNFVNKWSALGRDRVLTEMFDMIRSGLDTIPSGLTGSYEYMTERDASRVNGERFVVPIQINAGNGLTKGYGRFSTITQATIIFFATQTKRDPSGFPTSPPYVPTDTIEMQAAIFFQPFQPTPGMFNWSQICRYDVDFGGGFTITTSAGSASFSNAVNRLTKDAGAGTDGGEILAFGGVARSFKVANLYGGVNGLYKIFDPGEDKGYPFYSGKVTVPFDKNATFNFSGGNLTLKIRSGVGTSATAATGEVFQTIHMTFPPLTALPVPQGIVGTLANGPLSSAPQSESFDTVRFVSDARNNLIHEGDIVRSVEASPNAPSNGDLRLIAALPDVPASYFTPHPDYSQPVTRYTDARDGSWGNGAAASTNADTANAHFHRYATSLRTSSFRDYQYGIGSGAAATGNYETRDNMNNGAGGLQTLNAAGVQSRQSNASTLAGSQGGIPNTGGLVAGITYSQMDTPVAAHGTTAALMSNGKPGDWDSGAGFCQDGPYINKPDPGNLNSGDGTGGYYTDTTSNTNNATSFSPNRQVASPLMFGSLPTPDSSGTLQPWQTLLFCPNPASKGSTATDHYGFKSPKDYLMLDLFTMPVVEPYAISEPLSTAGKVNLNYQIVPFTYIKRDTAVRGVLKSMQMGAISNNATSANGSVKYKINDPDNASVPNLQTRYSLNLDETNGTLRGFEDRFATGDIFRSAAEVCSIFLVPNNAPGSPTYSNMQTWWDGYKLTGDNLRESAYNQIYPRVTTKSNSFTVHYRVQALKKGPVTSSTPVDGWNESREQVVSEYRGSTEIERYVDANDSNLPDFVTGTGGNSAKYPTAAARYNLDTYYKFRVIGTKKFEP